MTHKELQKLLSNEIGETRAGYCPCCDKQTEQVLQLLNPDDLDGFKVWECTRCGESIEID